jgi:hypothetical protein
MFSKGDVANNVKMIGECLVDQQMTEEGQMAESIRDYSSSEDLKVH